MRIIYALVDPVADVSQIARLVARSMPQVSRQLTVLKKANLVCVRCDKKRRIYTLSALFIVRRKGKRVFIKLEVCGDSVELGAREPPAEISGKSSRITGPQRTVGGITPVRRSRLA